MALFNLTEYLLPSRSFTDVITCGAVPVGRVMDDPFFIQSHNAKGATMEVVNLGVDVEAMFDATKCIDLAAARKLLKGRKGPPSMESVRLWVSQGCRPQGADGPILILPSVKIGGKRWTMPDWVDRFERTRIALGTPTPAPILRTSKQQQRDGDKAMDRLRQMGFKV